MADLDDVVDAGERIGGLQFEPLSIKRRKQMVDALREHLKEEDLSLFTNAFDALSLTLTNALGHSVPPPILAAGFQSVLCDEMDVILAVLSEFSGHPVAKLEELTPNEIRKAFEVMLQIPT